LQACIEFVPEAAMATVAERADLVIESVFEDPEVKKAVFANWTSTADLTAFTVSNNVGIQCF
jgi:3-hydroxyacyl-CoA dehydrogenase